MSNTRRNLINLLSSLKATSNIPVTVSALAKAAGISRSTIYKYYPDILDMLQSQNTPFTTAKRTEASVKIDLMKRRLAKSKELIAYLSNICSNQMVEIAEQEELIDQLQKTSAAKISYLESKIAKLEIVPLKRVK
ncbi:TetR family transcriptional regulator [Pseudomonas sp. CCM 7891]|jgi:AcrR family transcriptional regulator|uniref:TetR family transcriptional regulator n=1 Tax=Pseudomonas karstica TaxID=1055468 RepID=A0A7X2RM64_9PSED|nr:TetR family transcriptional regulator [Pseudomonas karstica]MTD17537.1 TetR family transcriptional regulator [Pseudomonas karstica]